MEDYIDEIGEMLLGIGGHNCTKGNMKVEIKFTADVIANEGSDLSQMTNSGVTARVV